ncbi:MAG: AI-2E family transporter [Saprospiraceae bacterium]
MILLILLLLIFLVFKEMMAFLPGLLGALTLYILSRGSYFQLVYRRKWGKGKAALIYLALYFLLLASLVYTTFALLERQVKPFLNDPAAILEKVKTAIDTFQTKIGISLISAESLANVQTKISTLVLSLLNDTATLLANLGILLFVLYFMLVHGKEMESYLSRIIPLKQHNIDLLSTETKRLVKVNAMGIPLISVVQGLTAALGYFIFGMPEIGLWGFLTGVFAFFPIVGTMIIWVPLVVYLYISGNTWNAVGLGLYSLIVTGNIDYLLRITLLKRIGKMHPLITVIGVIAGLNLFGFVGLIFGPLLVNYIILLFRIYTNEFIEKGAATPLPEL